MRVRCVGIRMDGRGIYEECPYPLLEVMTVTRSADMLPWMEMIGKIGHRPFTTGKYQKEYCVQPLVREAAGIERARWPIRQREG